MTLYIVIAHAGISSYVTFLDDNLCSAHCKFPRNPNEVLDNNYNNNNCQLNYFFHTIPFSFDFIHKHCGKEKSAIIDFLLFGSVDGDSYFAAIKFD